MQKPSKKLQDKARNVKNESKKDKLHVFFFSELMKIYVYIFIFCCNTNYIAETMFTVHISHDKDIKDVIEIFRSGQS